MKTFIATFTAFFCAFRFYAADILPNDPRTPLFVISEIHFDPPAKDSKPHMHSAHAGKPLLTVYSLTDLLLQPDKKGVRIILNANDAKIFSVLTHEHDYLSLLAGNSAGVIMHISGPIEDGSILFNDAHFSGPVAKYLLLRFGMPTEPANPQAIKP